MVFFKLALKSLWNRRQTTLLTVLSIGLSIVLLLSLQKLRRAAEDGFTQTISQVDLIVGARSGPLNLLLYTVFNIGNATNNISIESYEHFKHLPQVAWTVPYSLGDSYQGFRVVATNEDFFKYYRYRRDRSLEFSQGMAFAKLWEAVIGADVARALNSQVGQLIPITHGVTKGKGLLIHDDKPFVVTGILKKTGTPLDRAVYVTLEGMEAIHMDWKNGAPPKPGESIDPKILTREKIKVGQITSFFLRTQSRIETLGLQREINDYNEEPLLAIIPGATLGELWNNLSYAENILTLVSYMVVVVGLLAMLIALLTTLNERRREMAILRSLGASLHQILGLLVFESLLLSLMGVALGFGITQFAFMILKPWAEQEFGLYLTQQSLNTTEWIYLLGTVAIGSFIGLGPGLKAMNQSLKDGLSVRI